MKLSKEDLQYLIDIKEDLHQYPELGGQEVRTSSLVRRELQKLDLIIEDLEGYNVIGRLVCKRPGKKILLRADMDGLAIEEDSHNLLKKKKVTSKTAGLSHVCGHDGHTAILLTTARLLARERDNLAGQILFCFESGEENGAGVGQVLDFIENEDIDALWALHVSSGFPSGSLSLTEGLRMAGASKFKVEITGQSGHGAMPHEAKDPIKTMVDIIQALYQMPLKTVSPLNPFILSVGRIQGGSSENTIAESGEFSGTLRYGSFNDEEKIRKQLGLIVSSISKMNSCDYKIFYKGPNPPVINDPALSRIARSLGEEIFGKDQLLDPPASLYSESFGAYMDMFPGVYGFLGIKNEELGTGAPHHNGKFDIDNSVLEKGVILTQAFARKLLDYRASL